MLTFLLFYSLLQYHSGSLTPLFRFEKVFPLLMATLNPMSDTITLSPDFTAQLPGLVDFLKVRVICL